MIYPLVIVIIISKFLECHSKAKRRAPAYSRILISGFIFRAQTG